VRIQVAALLVLVANAVALVLYVIGVGLPLWWWGAVGGVLVLLVVAAQWRRCVPSSSPFSRSRSQVPPARR
jgi:hypothetical protein